MANTPHLIVAADSPNASTGTAALGAQTWRCVLGAAGVREHKQEGDGATPAGNFALRRLLYRPDRLKQPHCALPTAALTPADGWCDDPADTAYNRAVTLPYAASCEALWRDDAIYDLILVVGHNDAPPVASAGSAIFIHCAHGNHAPTAGCVAFAHDDLLALLGALAPDSMIMIGAPD